MSFPGCFSMDLSASVEQLIARYIDFFRYKCNNLFARNVQHLTQLCYWKRGNTMMYMHYCRCCRRTHLLNGHKQFCPKCNEPLTELRISYMDYVNMDMEEREAFKERCADEQQLAELSTTYRMFKYSKWYKESLKSEHIANIKAINS